MMNPDSRIAIRAMHAGLNLASRPALRGLAAKIFAQRNREPDLSGYPVPTG